MSGSIVLRLIGLFGSLSLVSFGGGNVVLPELHRQTVTVNRWMTDEEFASAYAIAQASPGPSTALLASLIGYKAWGWPGALIAAAAMLAPAAAILYGTSVLWERFRTASWRIAFERGLAPVSVGILLATGLIIVKAADHGASAIALSAVTAVVLLTTKLNPLWLMAVAGALGWLGLVR
ncbi:MAG: chromate transporter [Candidatus Rokubacteria bacterium]|nr:chromate transporter [Candidatus Rokubacteria bacterium]